MKYQSCTLLQVKLKLGLKDLFVGRLAYKDHKIWFEYDEQFLSTGLEISPFKLPLQQGAINCNDQTFDGLFGVFNDSLPDAWGRLLLDRQLRSHQIVPETLTALDRLAHVGGFGMGALRYQPDLSVHKVNQKKLNLDKLAKGTTLVLKGATEDIVAELLALNSSSSGARPKIMVGLSRDKKHLTHGLSKLAKNYEHWLIKFRSDQDPEDIGAIEYAYSLMAKQAGLEMMPTFLFPAKSGAGYFGVKRFDRDSSRCFHMHTASGLLHTDHRYPSLDYDNLHRATLALTKNVQELNKLFRLTVFNVLAHNRDDHSKNFAFLMDGAGEWKFAPAYDLTFSYGPGGEHSMLVCGEGKNPSTKELINLAARYEIKNAKKIIDEVISAVVSWNKIASDAGVSKRSKSSISRLLFH